MMKKRIILSLLVLSSSPVFSETIELEEPCIQSGSRSLEGTFDPTTGQFDIKTTIKDCQKFNANTVNGTVESTGTFIADDIVGDLDATIKTDLTIKHQPNGFIVYPFDNPVDDGTQGQPEKTLPPQNFVNLIGNRPAKITTRKCTKKIKGRYIVGSQILRGTVKSNCTRKGETYLPLLELIMGLSNEYPIDNGDYYPIEDYPLEEAPIDEEPIPVEPNDGIGDGADPLPGT